MIVRQPAAIMRKTIITTLNSIHPNGTDLCTFYGIYSGGHINPAVTVGVLLAGSISPLLALLYIICQLLGAIVGAGFARVSIDNYFFNKILRLRTKWMKVVPCGRVILPPELLWMSQLCIHILLH